MDKNESGSVLSVETNLFDQCTRYTNCVVEVLTNSITGETSVGWYATTETEVTQQ